MIRSRVFLTAASLVSIALVATLAVMWPGYDSRQLPADHVTVWALQTGEGKRYARVNTELAELDTVKEVENPTGIAQHGDHAFVFTDGQQRMAAIDPARPANLGEGSQEHFEQTPPDTVLVTQEGEWIAFLTASGRVYVMPIDAREGSLQQLDPYRDVDGAEGEERPVFQANTIALHPTGIVALAGEHEVITMSARTGDVRSRDVFSADDGSGPGARSQLTFVGDDWALFDGDAGAVWIAKGTAPLQVTVGPGALLQRPGPATGDVFIADSTGMIRLNLDGSGQARVADASGTPAKPHFVSGERGELELFGAWLGEESGTLWSAQGGIVALDYNGVQLAEDRVAEFVTNGSRTILNEQRSGWVWNMPSGELLPSSQHWRIDEQVPEVTEEVETQRVTDPKPPVAEPDHFGVRAGRQHTLQVLLNDHDPNEDVLSIDPASVTGLDPAFGTVTLANNEQQLVVQIAESAEGSAIISYRVTDGTTMQGLYSEPTTVTLTVAPTEVNEAPVWCGVSDCLAIWPSIDVVPGGTGTVNVLTGWVDPEGDQFYLAGALQDVEVGNLITTPEGEVTYQHPDRNSSDASSFTVDLEVVDAGGARATKPLTINVLGAPELRLEPFAVTGPVAQHIHVDVAPHITGAAGAAKLTSFTALDGREVSADVNHNSLTAVVELSSAESVVFQATVNDGQTETTGIVRVTAVDPATTPISTSPLTAFVHPGEDTTIDVLPVVSDPANSVLLISDLKIEADDDASLSVDVIGQRFMRATGDTLSGQPGLLGVGHYTVSDGSQSPNRIAHGEITFVLLPAAPAVNPIAVDDRVTVRVGAQIDIPVLDNDSVPSGAQMHIDPSTIVNEHDAGLAFATNRMLRYLAPDTAGEYTLSYGVYRLGFPSLTDTARVHISVIDEEANTAPTPPLLEGRVHSGRSVSIPFVSFGSDSDGDSVFLDRVVTQPSNGTAAISAEGDSIVFTSDPGFSGQDTFSYQVRDTQGKIGVGEVRVGVLDREMNPSPVTYSDYVQVQVGAQHEAVMYPLHNDIEPNGAALTLVDVRPNAPSGSTEFDVLESRLTSVHPQTGRVRIAAGEELGTSSYVYTVRNESGDVSKGLIIVKAVREPVPDFPLVLDTTLGAETLSQLPNGVDVMTGQVSWSTGDVADLTMSMWRDDSPFTSKGWRIFGQVPERAVIEPFAVTGTSFQGTEVTSYGFLRVPGKQDVNLSLRHAYAEVTVGEGEHVDVDLTDAVRIPEGTVLELLADEVGASGAREKATCLAVGELRVRYEAGEGAPWHDTCRIPVKLSTQRDYTYLSLRVRVIAKDPQPELRAAMVTVSPGETVTYDLANMVNWPGRSDAASLQFAAGYQGAEFDISQQGSKLVVTAHDAARQGRQEPVIVSLPSHPATQVNTLTVTVGPVPSQLPRGASVAQQCSQGDGQTSCLIPVVGQPGEVNPLPRTPLKLVSVAGATNCEAVTFSVENSTTVRASWAETAPGAGDCTGSFIVEDAQGRQSTGDRAGQIVLDLQGIPANPTMVNWIAYTNDSVTLQVTSNTTSYPAVTNYTVQGAGQTVDCPVGGQCVISGLTPGIPVDFTAVAHNAVGTSRGSASVTAWAYQSPNQPTGGSFVPVPNGTAGGLARITVTGIDRSTSALRVQTGVETKDVTVSGSRAEFLVNTTNVPSDVTITPLTKHEVPPEGVGGGSSTGQHLIIQGVHGIGAPGIHAQVVTNTTDRTVTVNATFASQGADTVVMAIVDASRRCDPHTEMNIGETASQTFHLNFGDDFRAKVCAYHYGYGMRFPMNEWVLDEPVRFDVSLPIGNTYTIGPDAVFANGEWTWPAATTHVTAPDGFELRYYTSTPMLATPDFASLFTRPGVNPGAVHAIACGTDDHGQACSAPVELVPTGAAYSPRVSFKPTGSGADNICVADDLTNRNLVSVTGLEGTQVIEQREHNLERWLVVSFVDSGLTAVESPRCTIPPPPPAPNPAP